jgi:hypothetical protein
LIDTRARRKATLVLRRVQLERSRTGALSNRPFSENRVAYKKQTQFHMPDNVNIHTVFFGANK